MTNDLTTGNPLTLIIKFAIPLLLGNLLVQKLWLQSAVQRLFIWCF